MEYQLEESSTFISNKSNGLGSNNNLQEAPSLQTFEQYLASSQHNQRNRDYRTHNLGDRNYGIHDLGPNYNLQNTAGLQADEHLPQDDQNRTLSYRLCRKIPIVTSFFALLLVIYSFAVSDDNVTRIPKRYQLYRNNYDAFDYFIETSIPISSFASKKISTIQDVKHVNNSLFQNFDLNLNVSILNANFSRITHAVINPINKRPGGYQVQEFFYKNNSITYYNSPITTVSYIKSMWPAIVDISFKTLGKSLESTAVEACNFKLIFDRKGFLKNFEGNIERKCNRAKEYYFYLVSQVEGNTDSGLKFFQGENVFATVSNKSFNSEIRDVVVEDETPFPSLIPTLYVIYYNYFKMKRQARDITRIPNSYQLLRDKLNTNNYIIQSISSSTIRAIIKAVEYPSGKYDVQEFIYETHTKDYSYILTTTNTKIRDNWPAIVEIYFTSSGNNLDPYSLEACNFRLTFSKKDYNKDIEGQIERRCPKAFESGFYLISNVTGNNDEGFKFFQNESEPATVSQKTQYREKRDIVVNDNSPFTSLIPGLYIIYYDYLNRKSHARDITRIPKIYQLRWNTIINAIQYISGYYEVQEFFYQPDSQDYFDTLVTAKATIQSLLPGIVEISFITSDKVLDPYALEACDYKLTYFENYEGQIERRCKRAFEEDFYMVSQVSGSTYWGLKFSFGEDKSKLSASTSAVYYWPSPRRRDVMIYDETPFPSIIPALYSVYYDY
ncbi:7856_t:CDS:2, partial [Gigaspora margarita]